jgi:divalent metal cation (Fe/Co/Zn/Cd) transporter
MDEGNPRLEKSIREVLDTETARRGLHYHELRYRETGNIIWVEYHVLFPEDSPLRDAHQAATEIEAVLSKALHRPVRIMSHLETVAGHDEAHNEGLKH